MLFEIIGHLQNAVNEDNPAWNAIANIHSSISRFHCDIEKHRSATDNRSKAIVRLSKSRLRHATNTDQLWDIIRCVCIKLYAQDPTRLSHETALYRNKMVDSIAICYNTLLVEVYDVAPISEWGTKYIYINGSRLILTCRRCTESSEIAIC